MKKLLGMMIVTIFLVSLIPLNVTLGSPTPIYRPIEGISHPTPRDRPALESSSDLEGIDATSFYQFAVAVGAQPDTGNPWTVPIIDDYYGGSFDQTFECVASGIHANIWIGLNDTVWPGNTVADYFVDNSGFDDDEWHFMYPWSWNASGVLGPAYPDGYHDIIYGKNLTYVLDEFDDNIWEKDTTFFGMYADRPGPVDDYKIQVLIFNIRDGLFWDPVSAPWFIEGYFWSYASELNDANIFHMDTWQWYRRLGPDPQPSPTGGAPRPHEYEGTFAHEFQHLIHYDVDSDEMTWVNEGCSTLAEYICGYGFSPGHMSEYLIYWWDTSLVIWQGELSNYGAVFLWTFYMYEHYGGALIWDIVHEEANGIEGYNNVLLAHSIEKTFDEIFQDWAIANYLDDTSFADGIYGYYALDIPSQDTEWYDIPYTMWLWEQLYPDLFDTIVHKLQGNPQVGWIYPYGVTLPYTANYVEFSALGAHALEIDFDGDDYAGIVPHSDTYEWHSDGTAWSWFRLGQEFSIPATGATLKFWSYYEIETNWDYGYVEAHDLNTGLWYTLPAFSGMTVSTLPNPQDNPYCPEENEPTAYLAADIWNAFTGFSGGWYQETMDLKPFAGHTIELYFTYWTDPYTLEIGWYVDDVEIPEIGFSDDVESGADGWTYTGWYITTGFVENDFEVNFIQHVKVTFPEELCEFTYVKHMDLDDKTEEGSASIPMINTKFIQFGSAVMVIAAQPGFEHTFSTSYLFYYQKEPMPILW